MDDQAQEFEYELAGRTIRFKRIHGGQLIMLQRMQQRAVRLLEDQTNTSERIKNISALNMQTLDLIESLFVNPEDVSFVEQKMLEGVIDMPEMWPILSGGKMPQAQPDDDEDPSAVAAVVKSKKPATSKPANKVAKKVTTRRGTR